MSRTQSKVSSTLQETLTQYGITRDMAVEGAKDLGAGPKYFGIRRGVEKDADMKFTKDLPSLATGGNEYNLAIVVPEGETFDMLATKNTLKPLNLSSEKDIRKFLLNLINSI